MIVSRLTPVLLLAALSVARLDAQAPPPPPVSRGATPVPSIGSHVVIVSGTATVTMPPDRVSFSVGVQTDGPQIATIVKENNDTVSKIVAMLKARGVAPSGIQTSGFSIRPVEKDDVRVGYRISNEVFVSAPDIPSVGELLESAIVLGANDVQGPHFGVANEKSVQDRCLALAFADAKSKALQLATLSERRLGAVQAVTDGSTSPFEFTSRFGVDGGVMAGVLIEPGVHSVDCGVTVAFALESR